MYSTCLFCASPLGSNEVIEHFPVGRRLAFDAGQGRLWVVCRRCERWNLTPLEERWEAIEECERLFRATRLRASTEHIGLARLSEGLDLVRIGNPQRPEIAAWRYGDQFGRRRRRQLVTGGVVLGTVGVVAVGGITYGFGVVSGWQLLSVATQFVQRGIVTRTIATVRDEHGTPHRIRRKDILKTRLTVGSDGGLGIRVAYDAGNDREKFLSLEGDAARQAAAKLLPEVNRAGGTKDEVQQAVGRIERAGSVEQFMRDQARRGAKLTRVVSAEEAKELADAEAAWQSGLYALSRPASLALEMALHEEQERRALEGELHVLEQAWRDAEEVGAIADSLLLPAGVESALAKLKAQK